MKKMLIIILWKTVLTTTNLPTYSSSFQHASVFELSLDFFLIKLARNHLFIWSDAPFKENNSNMMIIGIFFFRRIFVALLEKVCEDFEEIFSLINLPHKVRFCWQQLRQKVT